MNTIQQKIQNTFFGKFIAWLLSLLLVFQGTPAAMASLSIVDNYYPRTSDIIAYLNSEPGIVPGTSELYQANEVLCVQMINAWNIQTFYEWLQRDKPYAIDGPMGKLVGDEVVQARLIRAQLQVMTGRSLLNKVGTTFPTFATEEDQLNGLYQNAFNLFNQLAGQKFGQNIPRDPRDSGLSKPIVWPEYRKMGNMEFLVPVLYLPEDIYNEFRIESNTFEVSGPVTFENLVIDSATIEFGDRTFVEVAGDLINLGGDVEGEGDLAITAGNAFKNLSGSVSAERNLYIGAQVVENKTLVYQFDTEVGTSTTYGEIATFKSETGDLIVNSSGDILFEGSVARAKDGQIVLKADGNISLDSIALVETETSRFGSGTKNTSEVTYLQTSLSAKDTIQLIAGGQILIDAANIHSEQGHIEILSSLGITIEDEISTFQSQASGRFGKRDVTESVYQTVAIRSILDAGKGVRLHTDLGDITLRAVDITSGEGTTVSAQNGTVNLLTTIENDQYSYSSVKKGMFTTKSVNKGHSIDKAVPNTIVGGFAVKAAQAIHVEYAGKYLNLDDYRVHLMYNTNLESVPEAGTGKGRVIIAKLNNNNDLNILIRFISEGDDKADYFYSENTSHPNYSSDIASLLGYIDSVAGTPWNNYRLNALSDVAKDKIINDSSSITGHTPLHQQIAELAKMPGLEWMATVRDQSVTPDVDWSLIELQYETWHESSTSLSPAFAAVIAIGVAILTQDYSGKLAAELFTAAKAGTTLNAAVSAGLSSFFTQATLAAGNGIVNGDIVGAMEDFASDETLKSLATSMVTAGAIDAIDTKFFKYLNEKKIPADKINSAKDLALNEQAVRAIYSSAVTAGANSLILGADFEDSFAQSLTQVGIDMLGQHMASEIGSAFDNSPKALDNALKYISHAGSGCIIGAATAANNGETNLGSACASGAGGAFIGEVIATVYRSSTEVEDAKNAVDEFILSQGDKVRELRDKGFNNQEILMILESTTNLGEYTKNLSDLRQQGVDLARLGAAIGVFAAGADATEVNIASDLGANAAENNALFLLATVPVLLTAIDVALTGKDLLEIYEAYASGDTDKGNELLSFWVFETSVGAAIPGDKILSEIISFAAENGKKLGRNAEEIIKYVQNRINTTNVGETPRLLEAPRPYNVPSNYTKISNGNGTVTVTGPNGGKYYSTGLYDSDNGLPIFKSKSGGYVTLDGGRQTVSSPLPSASTIRNNQVNGAKFERSVINQFDEFGFNKNNEVISVTLEDGKIVNTIPDIWNSSMGGVIEAKDHINLHISDQLRAQAELALERNVEFNLIVSPRTETISESILELVKETNGNIYIFDPSINEFTSW